MANSKVRASRGPATETAALAPCNRHRRLQFDELGILIAAVLFFMIGAVSSPYFLTIDNLTGILQSITFLGFLSIGVGLALIAGEIDISVGSIYALSAIVAALLIKNGYGVPLAFLGGL